MERNTQLVGQSSSFLDAVERASRAAPLDRPVLVIGERGTGKELIAERPCRRPAVRSDYFLIGQSGRERLPPGLPAAD